MKLASFFGARAVLPFVVFLRERVGKLSARKAFPARFVVQEHGECVSVCYAYDFALKSVLGRGNSFTG